MNLLEVEVGNGKYKVVQHENGALEALRYGEPWRSCVGDNLVLCLAQEVETLRADKERLLKIIDKQRNKNKNLKRDENPSI